MCASTTEEERARQELVMAHRLFQRYQHKDTAWLIEFLLGEWRRVLGLDRTREISQQARLTAGHLEDRGTPLTEGE